MIDLQQYFDESHQLIRDLVRRSVEREVLPHIDKWEEAEGFPHELCLKAGAAGVLGVGYPEAYDGSYEGDPFARVAVSEKLMRCGSGGLIAGLGSLGIGLPPAIEWVRPGVREQVVPAVLRDEEITVLAVTEPSGDFGVASLKTRAIHDGDHYHVSGSETFITSDVRTDYYTVAVRTGGEGFTGISLLLVEKDVAGFSVGRKPKKMGWQASGTAELFFDNCRVSTESLIGVENAGFAYIVANFQSRRLTLAVTANMTVQLALEESLRWTRKREAFGKPVNRFQVLRRRLAEMATQPEVSREFTYRQTVKMAAGRGVIKEISVAKNFAIDVVDRLTYNAVQVLGGIGYMRESLVERLYRDSRILSIGGGSREIMNEIIGKQMGL